MQSNQENRMLVDDEMKAAAEFCYTEIIKRIEDDPSETTVVACLLAMFTTGAIWGASREQAKQVIKCSQRT